MLIDTNPRCGSCDRRGDSRGRVIEIRLQVALIAVAVLVAGHVIGFRLCFIIRKSRRLAIAAKQYELKMIETELAIQNKDDHAALLDRAALARFERTRSAEAVAEFHSTSSMKLLHAISPGRRAVLRKNVVRKNEEIQ